MVTDLRCQRLDKTCFACLPEGECNCLDDTDWGGKSCPFYKQAQYDYDTELVFEKFNGRFKRIRGYEGKYYVSEYGQVINSVFQQVNSYYTKSGLPFVRLHLHGGQNPVYLASIVADAWVKGHGKIEYRDHDPKNCNATNLYRR